MLFIGSLILIALFVAVGIKPPAKQEPLEDFPLEPRVVFGDSCITVNLTPSDKVLMVDKAVFYLNGQVDSITFYKGDLQNIRIFNRVITDEEIQMYFEIDKYPKGLYQIDQWKQGINY